MRRAAELAVGVVILSVGVGCSGSKDVDPLDPGLVRDLAVAQGSAGGDAHAGSYQLTLEVDSCDCPSVEFQGQTIDLCTISNVGALNTELSQGSGVLAIDSAIGLFTGAIESDDSFVVAGITDLSTLAGPLESLRRMDGEFSSDGNSAEGWAGQRLMGELVDQRIDCRWIGSFALNRI